MGPYPGLTSSRHCQSVLPVLPRIVACAGEGRGTEHLHKLTLGQNFRRPPSAFCPKPLATLTSTTVRHRQWDGFSFKKAKAKAKAQAKAKARGLRNRSQFGSAIAGGSITATTNGATAATRPATIRQPFARSSSFRRRRRNPKLYHPVRLRPTRPKRRGRPKKKPRQSGTATLVAPTTTTTTARSAASATHHALHFLYQPLRHKLPLRRLVFLPLLGHLPPLPHLPRRSPPTVRNHNRHHLRLYQLSNMLL